MTDHEFDFDEIEGDIWTWMRAFVSVRNEFYGAKFAPCPFALRALTAGTVDVAVYRSGDVRAFVRDAAEEMQHLPKLTTRVVAFPPKVQHAWAFGDFVESLNTTLIPRNIFLNTGVARTTTSKYPGSAGQPYFIVVANALDAVLGGSEQLLRSDYYDSWPKAHRDIVVERRARLARRYGATGKEE